MLDSAKIALIKRTQYLHEIELTVKDYFYGVKMFYTFFYILCLGYQSATRLSSPVHTSMMRLGSSTVMNRSMTAINFKNSNVPVSRICSGGVTVMTNMASPEKGIRYVQNVNHISTTY